jgi:hypothetical protein
MAKRIPGILLEGALPDGTITRAPVYNEHEVRAAAGLTMAAGTVAFCYAYFDKEFLPIKVVSTLFFVDFLIRVTAGLMYSPTGILARALKGRAEPQWVSAKPKQFAWTIGLCMSGAMTIITNTNVTGLLPRTICLICIALMWMESVLGVCAGCEVHGLLVRRGWASKDEAFEICAGGACEIAPHRDLEAVRGGSATAGPEAGARAPVSVGAG